ncbi:MAG: hypothetical protein Q8K60_01695 [Parachlamydiaceae bacterium]|nr:hypothetical protein [Parachlamydiaceae bacterium]
MLKGIPLTRALIYLIGIGLLPLIFVIFNFFSKDNEIKDLQENMINLNDQVLIKEKKQALNLIVRHHFRDADRFYIDKYLETLVFLEPEIETLQKIMSDKNFADDERIKKRLDFLTSSSNSLNFSEGVVQKFPLFQETAETLVHPVEVNATDIKKILSRIEGTQIGNFSPGSNRPQLVITDFRLDKKRVSDRNEVYLLNMKFIKREFI